MDVVVNKSNFSQSLASIYPECPCKSLLNKIKSKAFYNLLISVLYIT